MAIFYFIFVAVDWMLIAIGNTLYDTDTFLCYKHEYLIVENSSGAWFLMTYSLFFFSFSLLIWNIFYRLPDSYGLLKKRKTADVNVDEDLKLNL